MSNHPEKMPAGLKWTFQIIDWSMIAYWSLIALGTLTIVTIPESLMYDGYGTPIIDAWNWSFAPLDILFSALGLVAIRMEQNGDQRWLSLTVASLSLTFCAGLMAIGFWAIRGEYNPSWWIPNLVLMIIPVYWFTKLFVFRSINEPSR